MKISCISWDTTWRRIDNVQPGETKEGLGQKYFYLVDKSHHKHIVRKDV